MKSFIRNNFYVFIFFLVLSILILWQMLLPGYILNLDFSITPYPYSETIILRKFFNILSILVPAWFLQKGILLLIFFLSGYLTYYALPVKNRFAKLCGAVFYMINPFIYTRFLAGHFMHLLAYAFFPLFIYESLQLFQKNVRFYYLRNFFIFFFVWAVSPHYLLIYLLFFLAIHCIYFIKNIRHLKHVLPPLLIFSVCMVFLVSYYLIQESFWGILSRFDATHFEAFKSSPDKFWGIFVNLLSLHGFWSESMIWGKQFIWPKDISSFWPLLTFILVIVSAIGFYKYWKKNKIQASLIVFFTFLGLFMAVGYNVAFFQKGVDFLNTVFPPLQGFREPQKWLIFLVYFYVLGAAVYMDFVLGKFRSRIKQFFFGTLFFVFPILFCPPELFGFSGQVHPVWYPKSWEYVREFIQKDNSDTTTLVFPWHQYMKFSFNDNRIIANPAERYFPGNVIAGDNMETGGIYSISTQPESLVINAFMRKEISFTEALDKIRPKYILLFTDQLEEEYNEYRFLFEYEKKGILQKEIHKEHVILYRVNY